MRISAIQAIVLAFPVYASSVIVLAKAHAMGGEPFAIGRPTWVLRGAYKGAPESDIAWAAFRGDQYALWSAGVACKDAATAPATCIQRGSFTLDSAGTRLVLHDAETSAKRTLTVKRELFLLNGEIESFSIDGDRSKGFDRFRAADDSIPFAVLAFAYVK